MKLAAEKKKEGSPHFKSTCTVFAPQLIGYLHCDRFA